MLRDVSHLSSYAVVILRYNMLIYLPGSSCNLCLPCSNLWSCMRTCAAFCSGARWFWTLLTAIPFVLNRASFSKDNQEKRHDLKRSGPTAHYEMSGCGVSCLTSYLTALNVKDMDAMLEGRFMMMCMTVVDSIIRVRVPRDRA